MTPRILIDGQPADAISVQDRGFLYGDGLFETLAVRNGVALLWQRHMSRLQRGAERLHLPSPALATLEQEVSTLCQGVDRAVLKIIVTRGSGMRGYRPPAKTSPTRVLNLSEWPRELGPVDTGIALRVCRMRLSANPALAGLKHLNRLEQVLARAEWGDEYAEGIMLDVAGLVIEATAANVFAIERGVLYTPDLSQCGVAGVMRELVLERAAVLGIRCRIEPLPLERLYGADEVFLTNSLIGIRSVTRLEHRTYAIGETTQTLRKDLEEADAVA